MNELSGYKRVQIAIMWKLLKIDYLAFRMKIFASIMAFVVLFLSVEPALVLLQKKQTTECCGGSCHKDTDTQNQEQPANDNSQNNNCNPFQSCANTVCNFTVASSFFNIKGPLFYSNIFIPFSENFLSQFAPDFWQPPKIV